MLNKLLGLMVVIGLWQWWQGTQTVVPIPAPLPVKTASAEPVLEFKQSFKCDGRQHCSQMRSRAEAEFFIAHCPNTKMDGDHDGIPCERDSRW